MYLGKNNISWTVAKDIHKWNPIIKEAFPANAKPLNGTCMYVYLIVAKSATNRHKITVQSTQ